MTSDRINTGAKVFIKSLSTAEEGREWRLIHSVVAYTGWLILFFVCGVCLISPEVRTRGSWILGWLSFCLAYLVALEVLSRTRWVLYETSPFRMVRIQIVVFLGSALLWMTGGAESYFWFIYLWSLIATALYFPWGVTWAIFGEAAVLYFLASLAAVGDVALINLASLLTNLAFLLVFTVVFRYLVENVKRYQVTERKLKYSEILKRIRQDIDTAIGLQEVLDRILQRAVDLVRARDGSLMLLEEDGRLHFRARVGGLFPTGKEERTFTPGAPDEGVAGWVARNREPYVCRDTKADPQFVEIIAGGVSIRSLISVPIISHGVVLGVINVDSSEPNRFSAADMELLVAVADKVAVVIERAELLESLKQISEKTLGGAEDLHQHIVDVVHRLTRCPVSMWRVDETGQQAKIVAFRGISAEYAQEARLDLAHGVTGKAIRERKIIPVLDIQADPDFQKKEEAAREGWQSMLVVPLLAGPERAVGTLSIYSIIKREEFTRWELDLLRACAGQAGVAIQNSERLQTIQLLSEVGRSLATLQKSPKVLQETLEQIANTAMQVLGADVVDLYQYQTDRDDFVLPPIMVGERRVPDLVPRQIFPDDVVVQIAHTGEKIYASDAQKHTLLAGDWELPRDELPQERFVVREEIISSAAVPMKVDREVMGVMFAGYRQRRDFDTDVELRERIEVLANQGAIATQNARLFGNTQRRIRDLEIVSDVVQIISTKLDTQDLLETIVSQIAVRLECTHCTVFFPRKENGELLLVPRVTHGVRSKQIMTRRFKPGEGLTGWVFQHGKSLVLADARDDPRFALARERRDQPRSMLVVPVKTGDQTIGVISADQDKYGWFDENSRRLVDALARHAGVAIERAVGLELLQDIGGQIISAPKVDEVLQQIVSGAIRLTNTTSGVIYLISEDGKSVVKSFQYPLDFDHPKPRMDIEEGLTRQVIRTGEVLEFPDVSQDARVNPALHNRVRSMIAVPLKLEQDVIGVLYLNDADHHDFTEIEKSLLSTLAGQAAVAVHNASLFEKEQQRANAMGLLQEVSARISATLDVEETLSVIIKGAMQLTETESGVIHLVDKSKTAVIRSYEFPGGFGHPSSRFSEKEGLTWEVVSTGQVIAVSDITTDDRVNPDMVEKGVAALIGVPLTVEEKTIGAFFLNDSEPREFTEYEEELLNTLAHQTAIAIENARLYERLDSKVGSLSAVSEVGSKLTASIRLSEPEVIGLIYQQASQVMDTKNMYIALYDEVTDTVSFALAFLGGKPVDVAAAERWQPRQAGQGRTEWIIRERKPLFSATEAESKAWYEQPGHKEYIGQPFASWIGVPMITGEKVLGVIATYHATQEYIYDEDDLEVLSLMSSQAAIALDNARLVRQLEQRVQEVEAFQELAEDLSKGLI